MALQVSQVAEQRIGSRSQILEWHPILLGSNTFAKVFVYISPDESLKDLVNDKVEVFIAGTNSEYDGSWVSGYLSSSAYLPQYRPFFYNEYKYYTVLLDRPWLGYPLESGRIVVQSPQRIKAVPLQFVVPTPTPWPS